MRASSRSSCQLSQPRMRTCRALPSPLATLPHSPSISRRSEHHSLNVQCSAAQSEFAMPQPTAVGKAWRSISWLIPLSLPFSAILSSWAYGSAQARSPLLRRWAGITPPSHLQDKGGRSFPLAWPQVLGGWALVILCWPVLWYHVIIPIADLALGKRPLLPEDEQVGRARLALTTTHALLGCVGRAALAAQTAGHTRAVQALSLPVT